MNTAQIKTYAPKARRDFIKAVTSRAHLLGLDSNADKTKPVDIKGDVAFINGHVFPAKVGTLRKKIEARISKEGFEQVMEHVAYTWFNRFMALRYMELHGYLSHGCRVLSNPSGSSIPEILEHVTDIELPGLNKEEVVELKLAGNKDEELYALLIKAQCHALHRAMPFLFEKLDDETELLLPDNLLHTGSVIRGLVEEIDEDSWDKVEIIGWIYQFYISEKKDQVIGKVVKSEDIPAATQLFTPNWIVKYMVQNSLGRKWLATYPDSSLRAKMEYYIEPAEQTPEVQAELDAITPKTLNPEEITLLDPACGSGHILVEAYDVFKEIYLERGYRTKDISRLILEKNLYGLDIDDRAAQLTGFTLMMKARADSHNIFNLEQPIDLSHFRSIVSSACLDGNVIADALLKETTIPMVDEGLLFPENRRQQVITITEKSNVQRKDIIALVDLFKDGKTFGSLITVSDDLAGQLPAIYDLVNKGYRTDWNKQDKAEKLKPIVEQAIILANKYDHIVANPPYMVSQAMNQALKVYAKENYPISKSDLFSMFMERGFDLVKVDLGYIAMITQQSWMFLCSYESLRKRVFNSATIISMAHNGFGAFGADFGTTCFAILNKKITKYRGTFISLREEKNVEDKRELFLSGNNRFVVQYNDFQKIPGIPVAYWISNQFRLAFKHRPLKETAITREGMVTGNNELYLRFWYEISTEHIYVNASDRQDADASQRKWFPYIKGGAFRKWAGNKDYVVNWQHDGKHIRETIDLDAGRVRGSKFNLDYIFKPNVSWSALTAGYFSARVSHGGALFDSTGPACFPDPEYLFVIAGFLNSIVASKLLQIINPTVRFLPGDIGSLPLVKLEESKRSMAATIAEEAVKITEEDDNQFETSYLFTRSPFLLIKDKEDTISELWLKWKDLLENRIKNLCIIECQNNRVFIEAYGLQDELIPEVTKEQITLTLADKEGELKRLISYMIGCVMGRYSLDEPGIIYAHSGNYNFDSTRYETFLADEDGIVPITDMPWFEDDATNRFVEFIKIVWPEEYLVENLQFVAESIDPKSNEASEDTIRRYLSTSFFKDHLKTYKRRPIYWLFSSGKNKAFECLVYLHRYNESTLSRMRSSYVIPLQGKISARIDFLIHEIAAAQSTATKRKLSKELDVLVKKQSELKTFDEELRHYADQKITLDLDDGVKVNYTKFGNLLAEVKAVTGKD